MGCEGGGGSETRISLIFANKHEHAGPTRLPALQTAGCDSIVARMGNAFCRVRASEQFSCLSSELDGKNDRNTFLRCLPDMQPGVGCGVYHVFPRDPRDRTQAAMAFVGRYSHSFRPSFWSDGDKWDRVLIMRTRLSSKRLQCAAATLFPPFFFSPRGGECGLICLL